MRPADAHVLAEALGAVRVWPADLAPDARYGPWAELDVHAFSRAICRRLATMSGTGSPPPLRVGHSALVIGVASRLWSLTVVPVVTHGVLPDPRNLVVREEEGAVVLGVGHLSGWAAPTVAELRAAVLTLLEPLVGAMSLSRRLLWGNVAASLHAVPRVHELPAAHALVEALIASPPLAGELEVRPDGSARRRTCCLFYLVPGAGLCGDCVLDHLPVPPDTRNL